MKKIVAILLALLMGMMLAACGGGTGQKTPPPGGELDEETELTGQLNIYVNFQGYGKDWTEALKKEFGAIHQKLEINIVPDISNATGTNDIEKGTGLFDLVFSGGPLSRYGIPDSSGQTKLLDLTDVANAIPDGESRSAAEKMAVNNVNDIFMINNKYYALPYMSTVGGIHYNKVVLDNVFGEGEWELPVTTREFIDFLGQISEIESKKPAETRAYGITISPELAYWGYATDTWWAQYEGYEDFSNFSYAEYYDENGVKQVAKDAASFRKAMDPLGREKAFIELSSILAAPNINPVSVDIEFVDHQKQFATGKYQQNTNPSAFITCGDWYELETRSAVMEAGQPVRFMRTPVISSIVEELEDKNMTDETLAKVIRAIDGGARSKDEVMQTANVSLSENDFARLYEARRMVTYQTGNHAVGIPASARNVRAAKEFLVFMASDFGQQIFAKATGGLVPPYDYDITSDESIVLSEYVKSVHYAYYDNFSFLPVALDIKAPLVIYGGLDTYGNLNNMDDQFGNNHVEPVSYNQSIVNELAKKYETVAKFISPTVRG